MFRIWGRIEKEHKIVRQVTYESEAKFEWSDFFKYLADICEELDVATPILLKTHIFNYAKFNRVTFIPRDFAEPVKFDKLVLENILRKKINGRYSYNRYKKQRRGQNCPRRVYIV